MKKLWIAPVFALLAAASSFASDLESVNIHIEGTATLEEHWDFFMNNFAIEAAGAGYTVVEDKDEAEYTLQFQAEPYEEENPGEFSVQITVVRNEDGAEVLCFDYYFTSLDEINELNQFLFFQATISIPRPKEVEVETVTETVYETVFETVVEEKLVPVPESDDWRNKWLYARVSADYPITFYKLKGDGLIGGVAVYEGPYDSPTRVSPLDNSIVAMPGVTVGAELQFLNWMSVEPFFQLTLGRPGFYMFP
ncbi:MAG: hypothetical protein FWH38_08395, partial [Treponema sp.]|nr:hypothetical protein [Treponema sp.]